LKPKTQKYIFGIGAVSAAVLLFAYYKKWPPLMHLLEGGKKKPTMPMMPMMPPRPGMPGAGAQGGMPGMGFGGATAGQQTPVGMPPAQSPSVQIVQPQDPLQQLLTQQMLQQNTLGAVNPSLLAAGQMAGQPPYMGFGSSMYNPGGLPQTMASPYSGQPMYPGMMPSYGSSPYGSGGYGMPYQPPTAPGYGFAMPPPGYGAPGMPPMQGGYML
jgi:hypothetical protein